MIIRVIDFETTGLPPEASVCEAAYVDVDVAKAEITDRWQSLVCPTTPMGLEALATHHITEAEAQATGLAWGMASDRLTGGSPSIYVAHNADFEKNFFNPEGASWIDTYKVALRLWPDSPRHTNQVLRYYLGIELGDEAMPPHRALPDCVVTAHILFAAAKEMNGQDMINVSRETPYLTTLTFGKHRGVKYSDTPRDYLQWLSRQDMDAGVVAAANLELAK